MNIMKIVQLEYFCAATRLHSITQAAAELYVTQPAISTAIKELEKEFSINLFTRTKNHLSLTKEGEVFYQKAQKLLAEYNNTMEQFHDKLDLALVNMHFYEIDKLNTYKLMTDKLVFCVSKEHSLAKCHEITIDMIKDEPVIMYNTDSVQNETLEAAFKSLGINPHTILHASQLYTIRNFVCNNLGGAFLYSSMLRNLPGVIGLPINPAISQDIGIVWRNGSYTTDSTEKFINYVKNRSF